MKLTISAPIGVLFALALCGPAMAQPIQYQAADGINNVTVSAANPLPVTGGSGGGGDASAANQTAVQATAGSDASKAVAVQGITGGKAIPASQSGTWTVQPGNTANTTAWKVDGSAVTQPVSAASLPLPSGAATAANQTTANTSLATIATNSGSSIPAGTAIIGKVGIDQTTDGTTNAVHLVAGTAIAGKVGIDQTTPGTTNAVQPISGTTGGTTPFTLTAAASTNATNVKASAGTLYHIGVYNNSATLAWVSFYNTAGTPTCGTSIVYQTMIPANSTSGAGAVEDFATGMNFSTGIGICVATGIAGTGSVAATSYVVGLGYK